MPSSARRLNLLVLLALTTLVLSLSACKQVRDLKAVWEDIAPSKARSEKQKDKSAPKKTASGLLEKSRLQELAQLAEPYLVLQESNDATIAKGVVVEPSSGTALLHMPQGAIKNIRAAIGGQSQNLQLGSYSAHTSFGVYKSLSTFTKKPLKQNIDPELGDVLVLLAATPKGGPLAIETRVAHSGSFDNPESAPLLTSFAAAPALSGALALDEKGRMVGLAVADASGLMGVWPWQYLIARAHAESADGIPISRKIIKKAEPEPETVAELDVQDQTPDAIDELLADEDSAEVLDDKQPQLAEIAQKESPAENAAEAKKPVWLGAGVVEMDTAVASQFGYSAGEGLLIKHIKADSPFARAKAKAGDLLVSLAGKPVGDKRGLFEILKMLEAGQAVPTQLKRGKTKLAIKLTPVERPETIPPIQDEISFK